MKDEFAGLEVLARMKGVNIETKEICDKWLLITYDIPCTEAGNKARNNFLAQARMLGASKHTDSVYLLPWTKSAEALALQVAQAGEIIVWTANATDQSKAAEITKIYDDGIRPQIDQIAERLDKIEEHASKKRKKRALKMMDKTEIMLNSLEQAIIRRGSAQLYIMITVLRQRFQVIEAML